MGLTGDTFDLAVDFTRITAIGVGFMVMSAWCLGILNSHRSFFLPYGHRSSGTLRRSVRCSSPGNGTGASPMPPEGWRSVSPSAAFSTARPASDRPVARRGLRFAFDNSNPASVMSGADSGRLSSAVVPCSSAPTSIFSRLVPCRRGPVGTLQGTDPLHAAGEPLRDERRRGELPELSRLSDEPIAVAHRANAALRRIAFWMLASSLL